MLSWKFGIFLVLAQKCFYSCKTLEKIPKLSELKQKRLTQWKIEKCETALTHWNTSKLYGKIPVLKLNKNVRPSMDIFQRWMKLNLYAYVLRSYSIISINHFWPLNFDILFTQKIQLIMDALIAGFLHPSIVHSFVCSLVCLFRYSTFINSFLPSFLLSILFCIDEFTSFK